MCKLQIRLHPESPSEAENLPAFSSLIHITLLGLSCPHRVCWDGLKYTLTDILHILDTYLVLETRRLSIDEDE